MRFTPARLFLLPLAVLPFAFLLSTAGCRKAPALALADNNLGGTQEAGSDPASANMPSASGDSGAPPPSYQEGQPPDQSSYDPGYGEQPEYTDAQPPPPLLDYDQPPDPGDDYLWTPGYWAWSPNGYFWVPGAWVEAPYEGALWTPGYWGYWNNSYGFYPGYWGQYIGYYGGIDYGFGYTGYGYQGGYWGGGHFNYNRSVNNIDVTVVHNVYRRTVVVYTPNSHVSYNGGSAGLRVPARPAERVAMSDPHTAPMRAQVQNERTAGASPDQFYGANHGRPAHVAVNPPLAADRNVQAPPALRATNREVERQQQHPAAPQPDQRPAAPQPQPRQADQRPEQHPAAPQPERQAAPQPQRQQYQPAPQREAAPRPQREAAPQPQPRQADQRPAQRPADQQPPQRQAAPQQQPREAAPQPQHPAYQPPPQRQPAPEQQPRAAAPPPERQAAPPQRQAPPPQQPREAAPQPQRQAAPPQRQAPPPQQPRQAAPQPQQHKAASPDKDDHPKP